jgi:hypothetical protein
MRKETEDSKPIDGVKVKDIDTRKISFDYKDRRNGEKLTNVSISLNDKDEKPALSVLWNKNPDNKSWLNFLEELGDFAQTHGLDFDLQNPSQSNLDKRDPIGEATMSESRLFGTSKTSFQDVGEAKIMVRHSQPVNYNAPNGRTQHIERIFIENAVGERFAYPVKHLNGARALARHVAEGGTPYDDIGQHIISLSEEMAKLRFFKNYVERSPMISENMGSIHGKVVERMDSIKKQIHSLQSPRYYGEFRESFVSRQKKEVPEDILNDWIDRLTIRSFNEELKTVFPYIYNLVGEDEMPIKELDADDLLGEMQSDTYANESYDVEVPEFSQFENAINSIVSEDDDLFSNNEERKSQAMQTLQDLFAQELPIGTNGSNVNNSLDGIIDEKKLEQAFEMLAELGLDEMDARPIVSAFLKSYDAENGTDFSAKLGFEDGEEAPAEAPAAEAPPAEAPAAEAPPAAPMPAEVPPAAPAAAPVPAAPVPVAEEGEEVLHKQHSMKNKSKKLFDEIHERVSGFFNANEGTFTIGEEGFITKMCKEMKEKYDIEPDTMRAERFDRMVEGACRRIMEAYKTKHMAQMEQTRMLKLAGLR